VLHAEQKAKTQNSEHVSPKSPDHALWHLPLRLSEQSSGLNAQALPYRNTVVDVMRLQRILPLQNLGLERLCDRIRAHVCDDYARIATSSGSTPMMFMMRVRSDGISTSIIRRIDMPTSHRRTLIG